MVHPCCPPSFDQYGFLYLHPFVVTRGALARRGDAWGERLFDCLLCPVDTASSTCVVVPESMAASSSVHCLGARILEPASAKTDCCRGALRYPHCFSRGATTHVKLCQRTRAAFRANRGRERSNVFIVTGCFELWSLLSIDGVGQIRTGV